MPDRLLRSLLRSDPPAFALYHHNGDALKLVHISAYFSGGYASFTAAFHVSRTGVSQWSCTDSSLYREPFIDIREQLGVLELLSSSIPGSHNLRALSQQIV